MREWMMRLIDWFRRDRLDAELREELRFHHERLAEDARARGADAATASRHAHLALGNPLRLRESARERWSLPWLEHMLQDVRYALRGLRHSPGFTFAVVATLALGIGANVAMFGVLDRLMLRPFARLQHPERVHRVYLQYTYRDQQVTTRGIEYATYLDLGRWSSSFDAHAALFISAQAVGTGDAARERRVAAVSASFFSFFDAPPALGRYFAPDEDVPPRGRDVAVLSHAYWQSELGGRDVRGEPLQVGNVHATIIGVAPEGFRGVWEDDEPILYIPITTFAGSRPGADGETYQSRYQWSWMEMLVRRAAGVSRERAELDLTSAYQRSWQAARAVETGWAPIEVARPRAIAGAVKVAAGPEPGLEARTLVWVSGVAAIVLLIACANVANLFLARALRRRRETALRLALGVRRRRLVAQSLAESLVLALLGGLVGIVLAEWGGLALRRAFVGSDATFAVMGDARALGVALAAVVLSAIATGVAPVLLAGRVDLATSLKAGAREGSYQRSRARASILVFQGMLSMMLLVGAGLFVRSLSHAQAQRLGYDVEPILLALRNLRGTPMDDSGQVRLGRELLARAQTLPQVEAASFVSSVPFYSSSSTALFVAGIDSVQRLGRFTYQTATTDYFRTMGTRILRGRGFTDADRANAPPVAVVSESMARTLWPGAEAIGACMRVGSDTLPCTTVVGIAEDAAQNSLTEARWMRYYLPLEQFRPARGFALLLRMRGDPGAAREQVRAALQDVMPGETYITVRPLRELIDVQRRSWKLGAALFVTFGGLALVVAAVGLYGVIGYNVAQRMHEIGVRIALGARRRHVVSLVVGQGMRYGALGVVLGGVLALASAPWLEPLLFRQPARDPWVFGAVAAVLLGVAVLASALPAWRATRADPSRALRAD